MEKYLSKYIKRINNHLLNDYTIYLIKGSLCLYLHYLIQLNKEHNKIDEFSKPNDIDIDLFYVIKESVTLNADTVICRQSVVNVVKSFTDESIKDIDDKIKNAFTSDTETVLCNFNSQKLTICFERLDKKIFFGTLINDAPYKRMVIKYYDTDNNNFIDFFMDSVQPVQLITVADNCNGIRYKKKTINILKLDTLLSRYRSMYTNPSEARLKKLPSDIQRFTIFLNDTLNATYKEKIAELLKFFDSVKFSQEGGTINFKDIYWLYKTVYLYMI